MTNVQGETTVSQNEVNNDIDRWDIELISSRFVFKSEIFYFKFTHLFKKEGNIYTACTQ